MKKKLKKIILSIWRFPYRLTCKLRLKNKSFSLITSNCIGGGYYHDCFQQFLTPTINLTVKPSIGFFENLKHYLAIPLEDAGLDKYNHPLGKIGDIEICGVHYKNFESLFDAWEKRKKRVNFDNIYIITTEEYIITEEEKKRFDLLPYPKVCFISKKKDLKYSWQVYIPGYENCKMLGDTMKYRLPFGKRINEKYFDYIYFINNKKIKGGKV